MAKLTGPHERPWTRQNAGNFVLGVVAALVLAAAICTLAPKFGASPVYVWFELVTPSAMGLLAALVWGRRRYSDKTLALSALAITFGGLAVFSPLIAAPLVEVLIAAPMYVAVLAGAIAGDRLLRLCL
jgi:chromate transport protein ChrA